MHTISIVDLPNNDLLGPKATFYSVTASFKTACGFLQLFKNVHQQYTQHGCPAL